MGVGAARSLPPPDTRRTSGAEMSIDSIRSAQVEPLGLTAAPMHIALIGCTSAGKTTLARSVVQACHDWGLAAWTSEDFAARQLRFHWIPTPFVRRRVLELVSLMYALATWRRYRDFHACALGLIRVAPGSWLYKMGLLRLTLRKTGVHEIVRRRLKNGQVVVSDNEATLQGAHHLFVHPNGQGDLERVAGFASLAPVPDVVVYLRTSETVVVERALRRGHRRLGMRSLEDVDFAVRQTVGVFDRLCETPSVTRRLLVVDGECVHAPAPDASDGVSLRIAAGLVTAAMESVRPSAEMVPRADGVALATEIAAQLVARLNESVNYCHWKSNFALAHGEDGDGDLDLLVDRPELPRARAILNELGFREALVPHGPRTPGVWHYFGCDPTTGALVHVHLFSGVLTGESFVKSHRLPFDAMLLDGTETLGPVRVPSKAAELVLFVVRTFIKYGSLPDLVRVARQDRSIRAECWWLESQCSVAEALPLLKLHCPPLGEQLFLECLSALHNGESLVRRIRLAWRMRRRLRVFATRSYIGRLLAYLGFIAAYARRKLARSGKDKVWCAGGIVIAFVGADATGKSTLVGETARWLRRASRVTTAHLGKPPSSLWTLPINGAVRAVQAVRGRKPRWRPTSLPGSEGGSPKTVGPAAVLFALRAVVLAYDRRRAVRKTRLAAARGDVVICDRYPRSLVGAMDGPRLSAVPDVRGPLSGVYAFLTRIEDRLYHGLPQPDVLIELTVSVESAKRRNRARIKAGMHTDEDLESRHLGTQGTWSIRSDRRWRISTEGSLEETALAVKRAIWGSL